MSKKKLRSKIKDLKRLIQHMWVHDGYRSNGYDQMTTEQKKLYCKVVGNDYEEYNEQFFAAQRAERERARGGVNEGEMRLRTIL